MADYVSYYSGDQIDEAVGRALPGGALDTGKAPAGFGLGGAGSVCADCDTAIENGWYYTYGATANKPFGMHGVFLTMCRTGNEVMQIYGCAGYYANVLCMRSRQSGVWGEWEWVNPPMQVKVEYRTTERYGGKPVYVQLVNIGTLGSGSGNIAHGITNIDMVVSISASNGTGHTINTHPHYSTMWANKSNIFWGTTQDTSGAVYVTLKYTKTVN